MLGYSKAFQKSIQKFCIIPGLYHLSNYSNNLYNEVHLYDILMFVVKTNFINLIGLLIFYTWRPLIMFIYIGKILP